MNECRASEQYRMPKVYWPTGLYELNDRIMFLVTTTVYMVSTLPHSLERFLSKQKRIRLMTLQPNEVEVASR